MNPFTTCTNLLILLFAVTLCLSANAAGPVLQATDFVEESNPGEQVIQREQNNVGYIADGSWLRFTDIPFNETVTTIAIRASSDAKGGIVHVTSGAPHGASGAQPIASVRILSTGSWNVYTEFEAFLEQPVLGPHGKPLPHLREYEFDLLV